MYRPRRPNVALKNRGWPGSLTGYELSAPVVDLCDPRLQPLVDACRSNDSIALNWCPGGRTLREGPSASSTSMKYMWKSSTKNNARWLRARLLRGRIGNGCHRDRWLACGLRETLTCMLRLPEEFAEQNARGYVIARACAAPVAFASVAGPTGDLFAQTAGTSTIEDFTGLVVARTDDRPGRTAYATLHR